MTNEEKKAREIVERFYQEAPEIFGTSKAMQYGIKCALICVEEIIENLKEIETYKDVNENMPIRYWQTIKQIIETL